MSVLAKYFNKVLPKNSANAGARSKLAATIRSKRVMQRAGHGPNVRSALIKKVTPHIKAASAAVRARKAEGMKRLAKTSHSTTIGIAKKKPRLAAIKNHSVVASAGAGRRPRGKKASMLSTKSFST